MTSNTYRMPFAQWVYYMARENVSAHGRILAIHAAIFDVTGNEELCSLTGLSLSTLDKWKKQLKNGGWVIIRPGGGRGVGAKVEPAYHETPVTFTDVSARDPEKFRLLDGDKPPAEKHTFSPETPPANTIVIAGNIAAKPPVSTETPPANTGVSSRALACLESSLREDSYKLEGVSEEKEDNPLTPEIALHAFNAYNDLAQRVGLPLARTLTPQRRRAIIARMREHGGPAAWAQALGNIDRSAFLQGGNDRGWRASLDFLLQASSFTKVVEGTYGNGAHAQPKETEFDKIGRLVREANERKHKEIAP